MAKSLQIIIVSLFISTFGFSQNTNINRVDSKTFLDKVIAKKNHSINNLISDLSNNKIGQTILLKSGIEFKTFFDSQDKATEIYSKKCKSDEGIIKLNNIKIKSRYNLGIKNSKVVYNYALNNISGFNEDYKKSIEDSKEIFDVVESSKINCENVLYDFEKRYHGFFENRKDQQNVFFFNYASNPVKEIQDGYYNTYSTILTAPNEDFFITMDIPFSWDLKDKGKLINTSTKGLFEPYKDFLLASSIITVPNKRFTTKEEMAKENVSNNDMIQMFYEDDSILKSLLNVDTYATYDISTTLLKNGKETFIYYDYKFDAKKKNQNIPTESMILRNLGFIGFFNGKLFIANTGAVIDINGFNAFDYYSKIFYKMLSSARVKEIKKDIIYLVDKGNSKRLNVEMNNKTYEFLLDTGASLIAINKKVLNECLASGSITRKNFIKTSTAKIADGSSVDVEEWLLPKMKIGNKIITNVKVLVINSLESDLLFGLNGLEKLNIEKLDLNNNEIKINLN